MSKVIMKKANRQIKVDAELKSLYLQRGYDEIDEKGKVITDGSKKRLADYKKRAEKLEAENQKLAEELEALKAENQKLAEAAAKSQK